MHPYRLVLPNGAPLTGLYNLPGAPDPTYTATIADRNRSLLIAIHGGSYSST